MNKLKLVINNPLDISILEEDGAYIAHCTSKRPDLLQKNLEELIDKANKFDEAIELLKMFAFYCIDESIQEHGEDAGKVQEFLKTTCAKDWIEEQLALAKCEQCEKYEECENQNGRCE